MGDNQQENREAEGKDYAILVGADLGTLGGKAVGKPRSAVFGGQCKGLGFTLNPGSFEKFRRKIKSAVLEAGDHSGVAGGRGAQGWSGRGPFRGWGGCHERKRG